MTRWMLLVLVASCATAATPPNAPAPAWAYKPPPEYDRQAAHDRFVKRIASLKARAAAERAARCRPSGPSPTKIAVSLATRSDRDVWVRDAAECALARLGYVTVVPSASAFALDAALTHDDDPRWTCRVDVVLSRAGHSRSASAQAVVASSSPSSDVLLHDCIDAVIESVVASQVDTFLQQAPVWTTAPSTSVSPVPPSTTIFGVHP